MARNKLDLEWSDISGISGIHGTMPHVMGKLCQLMANDALISVIKHINKLSVPEVAKLAAVLTVCEHMIDLTLDMIHEDQTPQQRLKLKLEFLKITRSHWVEMAADKSRPQENDDDT